MSKIIKPASIAALSLAISLIITHTLGHTNFGLLAITPLFFFGYYGAETIDQIMKKFSRKA